ncbi:unnamed protein product [Calypogeia fissa]
MDRMKGVIPGLGLVTALLAVGVVKLVMHFQNAKREKEKYAKLIPKMQTTDGNVIFERFGDYVVRQMGLDSDTPAAKRLAKVAEDYLRGDKSRSDESLETLFDFLTRVCPSITDDEIEDLNKQFVQELDICMVTYFSFHWDHKDKILDQVMNGGSVKKKRSLKMAVLTATRKQRFERVMKELKTKRWFANMLEMMKAMGKHNASTPAEGTVVVPADSSVRSPVLLFIGGGMGAGKSTVVKEIMQGPFWKGVASEAVVVEADAFKENDIIYRTLSSMSYGENISEAAELVHESSTNAASSLLVTALNDGRDVILDGTMSWEPFVTQTVEMARDIHNKHYRMGPGYGKNADGTSFEQYWEPVGEDFEELIAELPNGNATSCDEAKLKKPIPIAQRKPYRIEFVGVICDAHMAVVRGMRRTIITKRGVPVRGQLRSHKLFTKSIEKYCELADHVKIYSTSKMGEGPELIALKDGNHKLLKDYEEFNLLKDLVTLNMDATSVLELNETCNEKWHNLVLASARLERQRLLSQTLKEALLQHKLSEWDLSSSGANSPTGGSSGASLNRLNSNKSSNGADSSEGNDSVHTPASDVGSIDGK